MLSSAGADMRDMTSVWKTKVLSGLNKIFDKDGKKAAAAEFLKSFNKEEIGKEIDDKKTELEPKVVEVVESSPPEIKALLKDKKTASKIKKNAPAVTKFLEELAKIEFPGAKAVSDAVAKSGTTPLSPAIAFILEKVAPFVPKEEPKAEPEAEAPAPAAETTSREVAVEEEKKEEAAPAEPAAAAAEAAPSTEVVEEKKEEEKPAEAAAAEAAAPAAEPEKQ
uniref:Salt stress root protein RS1 n=3 Tax=Oryza punctata TaxID=4537 RepID=A0A0E0JG16_ORYPU